MGIFSLSVAASKRLAVGSEFLSVDACKSAVPTCPRQAARSAAALERLEAAEAARASLEKALREEHARVLQQEYFVERAKDDVRPEPR